MLFRKVFSLPKHQGTISKARLYITAHGVYEALINDHRVGNEEMAPGWTSYSHRLIYQAFDVTDSLVIERPNVIGIEAAEGWFAGRLGMDGKRCIYGDRMSILVQLEVHFEIGHIETLHSDGSWKSCNSATTRSEIYDGEDYDSREEQTGWNDDPNFDESSWLSTEELPFPTAVLVSSDSPPVRRKEEIRPLKIFKSAS
jgi:alpha-L-rhamnosidase